jgi:hypothetical protein
MEHAQDFIRIALYRASKNANKLNHAGGSTMKAHQQNEMRQRRGEKGLSALLMTVCVGRV